MVDEKRIKVKADQIQHVELRGKTYECIPIIEIAKLSDAANLKSGAKKPEKIFLSKVTVETTGYIDLIDDIMAFLGESDPLELRKYRCLVYIDADISTDCQGSDYFRAGFWKGLGQGGPTWRPTWYGAGVYGANEVYANGYTQFEGPMPIILNEESTIFYFTFAAFVALETHTALVRLEFWKDEDVEYTIKSN